MDPREALDLVKDKYDDLGDNKAGTGQPHRALANLAQTVGGVSQAEAARDQAEAAKGLKFWTKILAIATLILGVGTVANVLLRTGIC